MNKHLIIHLFHIIIFGPLLIYIGYSKPSQLYFYYILGILGILLLIDILYRLITKHMYAWLYVHLVLFVPLFIYIAYHRIINQKIPNYTYSFLLAIGIAAFGYHLVRLF